MVLFKTNDGQLFAAIPLTCSDSNHSLDSNVVSTIKYYLENGFFSSTQQDAISIHVPEPEHKRQPITFQHQTSQSEQSVRLNLEKYESKKLPEDYESNGISSTNPILFDCNDCGAKFDNVLLLTEHNCYDNDDEDLTADNTQRPVYLQVEDLLPPGFIKCPHCKDLFSDTYYESTHQYKCLMNPVLPEALPPKKKRTPLKYPATSGKSRASETRLIRAGHSKVASCGVCGTRIPTDSVFCSHCITRANVARECAFCKKVCKTQVAFSKHERACYARLMQSRFETKLKPTDSKVKCGRFKNIEMPTYDLDPSLESFIRRLWSENETFRLVD